MRRDQTAHEWLIPAIVRLIGAKSYLELGTHNNETISKVSCIRRYGVDMNATPCEGVSMFSMTTQEFIENNAPMCAPFDVVFIDADHSADAVWEDLQGIWPHVSPDGLVFLHDMNPETLEDTKPGLCGDGHEILTDLHTTGHEFVVLPYHPGLAIIRKRESWGPKK